MSETQPDTHLNRRWRMQINDGLACAHGKYHVYPGAVMNSVVREGPTVFQVSTCEDETLHAGQGARSVVDVVFQGVYSHPGGHRDGISAPRQVFNFDAYVTRKIVCSDQVDAGSQGEIGT